MAGRIPQVFIDELLTRIDIINVIETRVPLKKTGTNYKACCPFHNEKTPSFTVSQTKQFYHCFGCGVSGNALGFLMEYDRLSFVEAVESLASQAGLTVPYEQQTGETEKTDDSKALYAVLAEASQFYQQQLRQHSQKDTAINYLKNRGVSGKIAKQFAIGYAPPGWDNLQKHLSQTDKTLLIKAGLSIEKDHGDTYDRFRQRIMFPIRDQRGRVIGFGGRVLTPEDEPKYLNSPETPVFQKRAQLYGLYEVLQVRRKLTKLLVVEGYMDVVALAQFEINYAVATLGTATTAEHIQLILRHAQHIVFCFDGDRAGQAAAWKALQTVLPFMNDDVRADFLFLPSEDDPDSLVRREGKAGFEARLDKAYSLSHYLFEHINQAIDLRDLDGQAKFANAAAPLLTQIPGNLLRYKLMEELARWVKMDLRALSELINIPLSVKTQPIAKEFVTGNHLQQQRSLTQQLITLLLQNPNLAQTINNLNDWQSLNLPGSTIFLELLDLLKKNPNLSTGALIEHWRENATVFAHLQKLASREILIDAQGIAAEFHAILTKLFHYVEEQLLESLQAKAEKNSLTPGERQQYATLLTKRLE